MADQTDTPKIAGMVDRIATRLGDAFVPSNPYTLRDLFVWALANANGPMSSQQREWQNHVIDGWLREFAREALAAMRDPTGAMKHAFYEELAGGDSDGEGCWHAMIEAALGR